MTPEEWLRSTDFIAMLQSPHCSLSERKLRLLIAAFCRHLWNRAGDAATKAAVEIAERLADGQLLVGELKAAQLRVDDAARYAPYEAVTAAVASIGLKDRPWAFGVGYDLARIVEPTFR